MYIVEVEILNIQSVKLKQSSLSTSGSRSQAEGKWSSSVQFGTASAELWAKLFDLLSICSDPHLRSRVSSSDWKNLTADTRGWNKFPGAGSRAVTPPCRTEPAEVVQASVLWARPTGRRPRGRTRTSWRRTLIPSVSLHVLFPEKVIDISPCQRKSEIIPAAAL